MLPHATIAESNSAKLEGSIKILALKNVEFERNNELLKTSAAAVEKDRDAKAAIAAAEHDRANKLEVRAVKAEKRAIIAYVITAAALLACAGMGYLLFKP